MPRFFLVTAILLLPSSATRAQEKNSAQAVEFFESRVRPVLIEHCVACHGPKKQQGGLRLDSGAAVRKGGDAGPIVVPGQPEKSKLIAVIGYQGEVRMPPRGRLPDAVIADLSAWVKLGAPWPESNTASGQPATVAFSKDHWAFQPVQRPALPAVKKKAWVRTPIDAFILARLEAKNLTPNAVADRRALLRRLKVDLIGLPPTFDEVAAFEADNSPDAYVRLVDRYLASPHYGERWGRHWLDIARYADTKGYVFLEERRYPFAYTYRDWVVKALNDDLPFDQFLVQQLAADRLVALKQAEPAALAAMGFLTLGRRFLNNKNDIIDDRIDVVTRGLLGLTVACARCHDHKYDPIPTADYYSLYGVFASSVEPRELPLIGEPAKTPEALAFQKKHQELQEAVRKYAETNKAELAANNRKFRDELRNLEKKADAFLASSPFAPARAMVLQEADKAFNPHVFLRGNPSNGGPQVPRQFLEVLAGSKRQPFKDGSGRLELARAIASKDNPLTARVLVNRLWQHHFGVGLVTTSSNFGLRGEPPSHPELLDYLASQFTFPSTSGTGAGGEGMGWSLKKMHRLIVLSNVYQLASDDHPAARAVDADNRLLARANRRRLDLEALRDGLLMASGQLDLKRGGPAVDITTAPFSGRRTIYGFIDRQNLPGLFRTFDFASPDTTTSTRFQTTVPQQALFLLNSPFMLETARQLLRRPELLALSESGAKVRKLYQLVYARNPDVEETQLAQRFLADVVAEPGSQGLSPWERYAQILLLANEFAFVD